MFCSGLWLPTVRPFQLPLLDQLPGLKVLNLFGCHGIIGQLHPRLQAVDDAEPGHQAAAVAAASAQQTQLPGQLQQLHLSYLPFLEAVSRLSALQVLEVGFHARQQQPGDVGAARGLIMPEQDPLQLAAAFWPQLQRLSLHGQWASCAALQLEHFWHRCSSLQRCNCLGQS